jgi:hypothetical protein
MTTLEHRTSRRPRPGSLANRDPFGAQDLCADAQARGSTEISTASGGAVPGLCAWFGCFLAVSGRCGRR